MPLTPQAAEHLSRSTLHLAKIQAESACSGCGNSDSQILRSAAAGAAWGVRSLVGCEKAAAAGIEPAIGVDWLPYAPSASRANHSLHTHAWAHPGAVVCEAAWLGRTTQRWRWRGAATSQIMSICCCRFHCQERRSALPRLSSVCVCQCMCVCECVWGCSTRWEFDILHGNYKRTENCYNVLRQRHTHTSTHIKLSMCVYINRYVCLVGCIARAWVQSAFSCANFCSVP